jgi:hypothetical protein
MKHIQFTKSCYVPKNKAPIRHTFGREDLDIVLQDSCTFSKAYLLVQLKRQAIVQMIDYIYFNPMFPQNQTIKYMDTDTSKLFIWNGIDWYEQTFHDASKQILINVEKVYHSFFQQLSYYQHTHISVILNSIDHICKLMFAYFRWNCDFLETLELDLIGEQKKKKPIMTSEQKLKEYDIFATLMDNSFPIHERIF